MDCLDSLRASLRDATKNFDTNISAPLEAFLLELSSHRHGTGAFSFARAGFVVAASTQVYAKKVDHLCFLVEVFSAELTGKRARDDSEEENARRKRQSRRTMALAVDFVSHEELYIDNDEIDEFKFGEQQPPLHSENPAKQRLRKKQFYLLETSSDENDDAQLVDWKGEAIGRKVSYQLFTFLGAPFSDISDETSDCATPSFAPASPSALNSQRSDFSRCCSTPPSSIHTQNDSGYGSSQVESEHVECSFSQNDIESIMEDAGDADSHHSIVDEGDESIPAGTQQGMKLGEDKKEAPVKKTSSPARRRPASKRGGQSRISIRTLELSPAVLFSWVRETPCPLSPAKARRLHRGEELPPSRQQRRLLEALERLKGKRRTSLTNGKDSPQLGDVPALPSPNAEENGSLFHDDSLPENNIEEPDDPGAADDFFEDHEDIALVACPAVELQDMQLRVAAWDSAIRPLLDAEEERECFDIKLYGDRVMDAFSNTPAKQTRSFKDVCSGVRAWQVARYFAATLQLANSGNVSLTTSGDAEAGMDTLCLTLLSRRQNIRELEESGTASHCRKQAAQCRDADVNQER
ncbi:uncharacterized protein LOC144138100 [Haemaphysalis longicornis]